MHHISKSHLDKFNIFLSCCRRLEKPLNQAQRSDIDLDALKGIEMVGKKGLSRENGKYSSFPHFPLSVECSILSFQEGGGQRLHHEAIPQPSTSLRGGK